MRLAPRLCRRPRILFVGINPSVHSARVGHSAGPGPGAKPERLAGAAVFVVPNPSGRNAAFPGFADKLQWYRRLRRWAEEFRPREPAALRPGRPARPGIARRGPHRRRGDRMTG